MLNRTLIWNKFYKDIIPSEYWNYQLQNEFAEEATNYYILFNELSVIDLDSLAEPYVFTKQDIADEIKTLLGKEVDNFSFSTNANGGMVATYLSPVNSLILTVEVQRDYSMEVDYIFKGISGKVTYNYEVPLAYKCREIENLFRRLL